jgi:glycosyltransferase involved in cell wall biosynthesis
MNFDISIIIAVKNEEDNLPKLFDSLKDQTHKNFETIVIDNNSKDKTQEISFKFTPKVFNIGPERSSQRNYGAKIALGKYILMLDADMILAPNVLESCLKEANKGFKAVIIDEEATGEGFWADCRKLEKSFYLGNLNINAARFYDKELFLDIGGYDNTLISGEDWDLSQRASKKTEISFAKDTLIYHALGESGLVDSVKKKFYYGLHLNKYSNKEANAKSVSSQMSPVYRYKMYLSSPAKLLKNPLIGVGMLFLKTMEFGAIAFGYLLSKIKK